MDYISSVKAINIKTLIEQETELKFNAKNTLSNCPFCKSGTGKNSSSAFNIQPEKNIFSCFSCGAKGNNIEFIKYFKNISDNEAIMYLHETYENTYSATLKISKNSKKPSEDFDKTIYAIKNNKIIPAIEYLRSRNIRVDDLPKDCFFYDSIDNAIVFIDGDRKLINKRLFSPKNGQKAKFGKGSVIKNAIYDCTYNETLESVFLTEGVINALSLFDNSAIAIFTTENKITDKDKLSRYIKNKKVVLSFDGDEPGKKCTEYYLKFIQHSGIEVRSLFSLKLTPDQDLNDLLKDGLLSSFLSNSDNYELLWENLDHIDILMKPIPKESENPNEDFDNYQFFKKAGRYYTFEIGRNKKSELAISNFIMEILYHFVDGSNNTKRLIKIQRYTGERITIEVLSSEAKPDTFETILKSQNCTFLGSAFQLKSIFMVLMDSQREAYSIDMLGYIPEYDVYAFADCILNKKNSVIKSNQIGISTDENRSFYLPAFAQSNINNKSYNGIRKFRYKEGKLKFQEWTKLIYEAYNVNGSISICYLINSLFRDIVFTETGFFPFLYLFGQPGVGKSSFIDFFLRLFGDKEIGISIKNSTVKGIARSCSQKRNSLIFLKEFENTIEREIIAFFKNAYDGATYTIAQKSTDNKTDSYLIESAMVIDGNVLPTAESALYDRMLVLHFESHHFSQSETAAFKCLVDESEKGLGQIIKEILSHRDFFKANFKTDFRKVYDEIKYNDIDLEGFALNTLPERTIKHIAFLLTPFKVLNEKLQFPFDYNELVRKIIQDAIDKYYMLSDIKDVSVFWDAINWERNKDLQAIKEGKNYLKDYPGKVLYIKLNDLYPFYMAYCKTNNLQYIDRNSLFSLLTSTSYAAFISGTQKDRNKSIQKRGLGTCHMFRFEITSEEKTLKINGKEVYL